MMGVFTYDQQPFSHPRDPTTVSQVYIIFLLFY